MDPLYHKAHESADRCLAYAAAKNREGGWEPDRDKEWQRMLREDDAAWAAARSQAVPA